MKARRTLSRWRADLIGNARDQQIKDEKQSQSLRNPIMRDKQAPRTSREPHSHPGQFSMEIPGQLSAEINKHMNPKFQRNC